MSSTALPVTGTGTYTLPHCLAGWYFTETGGANSITVTIRVNNVTGTILEKLTIAASGSVGEDYSEPITGGDYTVDGAWTGVYVAITGTGTVQGHVRGH